MGAPSALRPILKYKKIEIIRKRKKVVFIQVEIIKIIYLATGRKRKNCSVMQNINKYLEKILELLLFTMSINGLNKIQYLIIIKGY